MNLFCSIYIGVEALFWTSSEILIFHGTRYSICILHVFSYHAFIYIYIYITHVDIAKRCEENYMFNPSGWICLGA